MQELYLASLLELARQRIMLNKRHSLKTNSISNLLRSKHQHLLFFKPCCFQRQASIHFCPTDPARFAVLCHTDPSRPDATRREGLSARSMIISFVPGAQCAGEVSTCPGSTCVLKRTKVFRRVGNKRRRELVVNCKLKSICIYI